VGVLSALAEVSQELGLKNPFKIYTGVSAGAINASFLASGADDFAATVKSLVDMWSHLTSEQVFYTDAVSLGKIGFRWLEELSFGSITGVTPGRSLLDTSPLKTLISHNLKFENIQRNIDSGKLRAVGITAIDYGTSAGITFVQAADDVKLWDKNRRRAEKALLKTEHVMASSAIPMLFPPISVDQNYYGDGCIRNQSPCGPAIYLGAEKLVVIGVRLDASKLKTTPDTRPTRPPSVAKVLNVLLNAVMLDGIELDLERLDRVNQLITQVSPHHKDKVNFKRVEYCWISPSMDIGEIAQQKATKLPRVIRYLMKGLGSLDDAREIVSYLLFEPSFCTQLIEIGFEDGMRQKEELKRILLAD
jgi:NTE family protein